MNRWKRRLAGVMAAACGMGVALAQSNAPAAPAPKPWADSLSFKGDLRYRFETIQDDSKKDADGE